MSRIVGWLARATAVLALVTPLAFLSPQSSAAHQAAPTTGGSLVVARRGDFQPLDPATAIDYESFRVMNELFSGLMGIAPNNTLYPDLAASLPTVSNGSRAYTFHLRPGLRFADGTPLTASDVAFSINRAADPKIGSWGVGILSDIAGYDAVEAGKAKTLSGVQVLDPLTIRFMLTQPDGVFSYKMTISTFYVVEPRQVARYGSAFGAHPLGSGPFKFVSYVPGQRLVVARNPYYYRKDANGVQLPYLDQITWLVNVDDSVAVLKYERGEVDVLADGAPKESYAAVAADRRFSKLLIQEPSLVTYQVGFNARMKPFTDVRVRRAFAMAINRNRLIKLLGKSRVFLSTHRYPQGLAGWDPTYVNLPYDPTKAKALLAQAGYPNGFTTTYLVGDWGDSGDSMAIVVAYATDDRYTDDVHYDGGARRRLEIAAYPLWMIAMNALPPHADLVGERWADIWDEHLRAEPWLLRWSEEQCDGPYWRQGSLRPRYDAIQAATLLIGGWADGYRNWPLRTFANLRCPKRLILGPWGHEWPRVAYPGPRIDDLDEAVRWFRRYLTDDDTDLHDDPPIALYVHYARPPEPRVIDAPGYWRAERTWPIAGTTTRTLYLGRDSLDPTMDVAGQDTLTYDPTVGLCAPWTRFGGSAPGLHPVDQRPDEAYSLVYTTPPLETDWEVVGSPIMVLHVSATAAVAFVSVKVSDVAEDGRSTLVTRGFLNLTRRASLRDPEPLEPGQVYEARIELDCCAWIFSAGRRIRVAIAGSDWPNVWPAPDPCVHTVWRGAGRPSRVELPLAPAVTLPPPEFGAPTTLPPLQTARSGRGVFQFIHDYDDQTVTVHGDSGVSAATTPHNPAVDLLRATTWTLTASRVNPARVTVAGTLMYALRDRDRETRAEGMIDMTSDRGSFHIVITLSVTINGTPYVQRSWTRTIPRQLL